MILEKTFIFQYVILQHAFTKPGAKGLEKKALKYLRMESAPQWATFEAACFSEFKQMLNI